MKFLHLLTLSALIGLLAYCGWTLVVKRKVFVPHFNPWTAKFSTSKLINESMYDCTNCSWNTYEDLESYSEHIDLFNDEAIPEDTPEISCMPESFGYKTEEAEEIFPDKHFKNCSELVKPGHQILDYNTTTNLFTMNCGKSKFKGKYAVGEDADSEVLGRRKYLKEFEEYEKPVKLNKQEFVYGTCDEDKDMFLDDAVYRHRPKKEILERPKEKDPLKILMIVWDSVSRRSFFRKMPETVKFLNNMSYNFSVFDMKIHNVMGEYSANNIMPQSIGDIDYKMYRDIRKDDIYSSRTIWNHAHKKNFTTLFIEEGCTNDLARYLGKEIKVDHIGTSFWCAGRRFNEFENNSPIQRCIGRHHSHAYVYNYIQEFSKNYNHQHQWIFTHINTAHEPSGLLLATMDLDTVEFLDKFLEENSNSNTAVIITGDHGMRYGEWFKKMDGSHEHRLPLGLVIASNKLLKSIPNSYDTLRHNGQRLTSKLDLYTTQLHLIETTQGKVERDSKKYLDMKKYTSENFNVVSLFLEKVMNNRTCFDIGIPAFWCSCLKFVEVTEEPEEIVYKITQILVDGINEEVYRSRVTPLGHVCQKLTLNKIKKLWVLRTDEEYYKIQFTVNEQEGVLFESVALLTWKNYRQREPSESYSQIPFYDYGKRTLSIMFIRRVDSYAGKCEDLAKEYGVRPEACICNQETLSNFN